MKKIIKWILVITALLCAVTFVLEILAMCGVISVYSMWLTIFAFATAIGMFVALILESFYNAWKMWNG